MFQRRLHVSDEQSASYFAHNRTVASVHYNRDCAVTTVLFSFRMALLYLLFLPIN